MRLLIDDIKKTKELKKENSKNELELFYLLVLIEKTEAWKEKTYYKGSEALAKYSKATFNQFLIEVFEYSVQKYKRTARILKTFKQENYLEFGYKFLTSIVDYNKDVQEKVIVYRRTHDSPKNSSQIRIKLFPSTKTATPNTKSSDFWKEKYLKIKAENKKLNEKIVELEEQHKKLMEALAPIMKTKVA